MASLYEELITLTAEDGASTPCILSNGSAREAADLLDAWFAECHHAIEYRMLLDRACRLLSRIVAEGDVTPQSARCARALIRAVKLAERAERSN